MKFIKLIFIIIFGCLLSNCESVLDKTDLASVSEDAVWNDLKLATAYIYEVYDDNLPDWDRGLADRSDESDGAGTYMYGQLTEDGVNHWPYGSIRNINILLDNIDAGTIEETAKNRLKGEALFFRAWRYFEMVRLYGGVPLILNAQKRTDELLVERASTSVVMAQVIKDLDDAIAFLPSIDAGSPDNKGRVHKGTAMAMKGRVLLYYASPQFDPEQNIAGRWQDAYNANKAAKTQLESNDYGLLADFSNIWLNEMNKEVIFVRRYEYPAKPDGTNWSAATRPLDKSQGRSGGNQPVLEMVEAFPMKDGKAINDPASVYTYDPDYFWQNRDPRFDATIVYNGSRWNLIGFGEMQWTFIGSESNSPTTTGYYCRKAVDTKLNAIEAFNNPTDYVELRYAEVLLNLAEAANKVGQTDEAYEQLKAIRARAGIDPGTDNFYGLEQDMTQNELHETIIQERKIELAFEGKRHWDLRRNRMFEGLLNGTRRTGHRVELVSGMDKDEFFELVNSKTAQEVINLMNTSYSDYFNHVEIERDIQFPINWKPEYYFFAIPQAHTRLNSNLMQTLGWPGGTFDPLQ